MNSLLSVPFAGGSSHLPRGYTYAPDTRPDEFAAARPGLTIGTFKNEPPWIVVDLTLDSVVVASWPGKLWEVQVLDRASDQPMPEAGYVRATAVRVEDEVPSASLFGKNGVAVEEILGRAQRLTIEQRDCLASHVTPGNAEVFSAAWNKWLSRVHSPSPHQGEDHSDTLSLPMYRPGSPIGSGFTVLYSVLSKRASALEGDDAFTVEDGEVYFSPSWAPALSSLLHACMAVGTDADLLSDSERLELLSSYSTID
jgi:hypothetical protein